MFGAVGVVKAPADILGHFAIERPLRLAQLQVIDCCLTPGKLHVDLAAPVADHHIVEQPPQRRGVARLTRIVAIKKVAAEGQHRAKLPRRQDRDQAVQLHQIVLHRRRRQHQHVTLAHLVDKLPGQCAAIFELVRLIHNQQIIVARQDRLPLVRQLGAIKAGDPAPLLCCLHRLPRRRLLHYGEGFVELVLQLLAPLFGKRSRREHQHGAHQPALDQFFHDNAGFDCLAQPHLVGQQRPPAHLAQRTQRRLQLVRVMLDGDLVETDQPVEAATETQRLCLQP